MDREWESRYLMGRPCLPRVVLPRPRPSPRRGPIIRRHGAMPSQVLSLASVGHRAADHLGWAVAYGAQAVEALESAPPIIAAEALMALVSAISEAGHSPDESARYLRHVEAQLALHQGNSERALEITTEMLNDPLFGSTDTSLSNAELVHAEALQALGRDREASQHYRTAAESLEREERMRSAVDAWRRSLAESDWPNPKGRVTDT